MIPGLEMLACQDLAVPLEVMEHVVRVESSFNPYAIGVVGARLARQPRSLEEAVATASQLEREGYNFSLGLAQVNRHNLASQGLADYSVAFSACPNLAAGSRILADCHARSGGDWDKAFSCYYSGNFTRGFRDGYVQKVRRSMAAAGLDRIDDAVSAIPVLAARSGDAAAAATSTLTARRSLPAVAAEQARPSLELPDPHAAPASSASATQARLEFPDGPADVPFVPRVSTPDRQQRPSSSPARGDDAAFVF